MKDTTASATWVIMIRGYTKSVSNILPMNWVILSIVLASLVLFIGKSPRFFMAAVAHNFLILQIYVLWRQLTSKQWIHSSISILFAMILFASAGSLVNILQIKWLLIAAIAVLIFLLTIKSVRHIYTNIFKDLPPRIMDSVKSPKVKNWAFAIISILLTLFVIAGFFTPGSAHALGSLLKLIAIIAYTILVFVVYLLLASAVVAFPLAFATVVLSIFLLGKCESDPDQKPQLNQIIPSQESKSTF